MNIVKINKEKIVNSIELKELIQWVELFDKDLLMETKNVNNLLDKVYNFVNTNSKNLEYNLFSSVINFIKKLGKIDNYYYEDKLSDILLIYIENIEWELDDFLYLLNLFKNKKRFGSLTHNVIINNQNSYYSNTDSVEKIKKYILSNNGMSWVQYYNLLQKIPNKYFDSYFLSMIALLKDNTINLTVLNIFIEKKIIINSNFYEVLLKYYTGGSLSHKNYNKEIFILLKNIPINNLNVNFLNVALKCYNDKHVYYIISQGVIPDESSMEIVCLNFDIEKIQLLNNTYNIIISCDLLFKVLKKYNKYGPYYINPNFYNTIKYNKKWISEDKLKKKNNTKNLDIRFKSIEIMLDTRINLKSYLYKVVYLNYKLLELLMAYRCPMDYELLNKIVYKDHNNIILKNIRKFGLDYGEKFSSILISNNTHIKKLVDEFFF